ncbi:MAG: DUF1800 family protein [Pseudomonadota bacterium]
MIGMFALLLTVAAGCAPVGESAAVPPISPSGEIDGGAGEPSDAEPEPIDPVSLIKSESGAARFLARATFGGSKDAISALTGTDAADWVATELAKPYTLTLPILDAQPKYPSGNPEDARVDELYWDQIVGFDDQLRQRMVFALSQILVYSDEVNPNQFQRAVYQDILIRNAFGNYRDLLEEVTYSLPMGEWLTYLNNRKGDPNRQRMPDENYAREILQLFSIGLVELNLDGTPKLDGEGRTIETYADDDLQGLARVFTGLSWAGGKFGGLRPTDAALQPMQMYDEQHSDLEKSFLGTTIPAGTPGDESIDLALDAIFEHPNVAPFVSRQLIQRFTQSNPSPQYVERVSSAFNDGRYVAEGGQEFGTGVRGDLSATIAAVLLDEDTFMDMTGASDIARGKVREPILRFTNWARAFSVSNIDASNEKALRYTSSLETALGQQAFKSDSVFNFYRPGYVPRGTIAGDLSMTIPEFQIVNEGSTIGYMNFMLNFVFDFQAHRTAGYQTYTPDYSEEHALAEDPAALVDHLDVLLTGGRMSEQERLEIMIILDSIEIHATNPDHAEADRDTRVKTAIALIVNSPSYILTW